MREKYIPDPKVAEYFRVLEPEWPEWLSEYINTPAMLQQGRISNCMGWIYSDLFECDFMYSSLDHSVGVALIVWHFTRDRRQALAGLFHDIATPCFKHCVDFMNGDYTTQESTEDLTSRIIAKSPEIGRLLERDGITVAEVDNYHLYPIADNDTPQLSADRLEYTLSNGLFLYHRLSLDDVRRIYQDIEVQSYNSVPELGFKTERIAREFTRASLSMSPIFHGRRSRYSMQLTADILKRLSEAGKITVEDLYRMGEYEVVEEIERSEYGPAFKAWRQAKAVEASSMAPSGVYAVHCPSKIRYIDPLCEGVRLSSMDAGVREALAANLAYNFDEYIYIPGVEL